jgi:predicted DNA binding CopG/RHH family protein
VGNIKLPWGQWEARSNVAKHGVTLREAQAGSVIRLITRHSQRRKGVLEFSMRKEYDFSQSRKNSYAKQLRRQITIRLDIESVDYFKELAAELGMPYQNLINLFLRDCAVHRRRPAIDWRPEPAKAAH